MLKQNLILSTLGVLLMLSSVAQAQNFGTGADSAGAVLGRELNNFNTLQRFPFMYRPITKADFIDPANLKAEITFEEGVLPPETSVQGMLVSPDGKVYISPGGGEP